MSVVMPGRHSDTEWHPDTEWHFVDKPGYAISKFDAGGGLRVRETALSRRELFSSFVLIPACTAIRPQPDMGRMHYGNNQK